MNHQDTIAEIAGNQEVYNNCDLSKLSLEQAIRLLQLHKMNKTHKEMASLGTELKQRHKQVQELHKLLQLISKATTQGDGDDRGKLVLTHPDLSKQNVDLAHDLTKLLKAQRRQGKGIDLSDPKAEPIRAALAQAKAQGLDFDVKDTYAEVEIVPLYTAIRDLTGIKDDEIWNKVQDIREIRTRLQEAKDVYHIEFKWPVGEYSREEREALVTAIDSTCKDFNLQNDMQMHDLNRGYQERLEILQMARSLIKTLHDDKVHKARSSSGR